MQRWWWWWWWGDVVKRGQHRRQFINRHHVEWNHLRLNNKLMSSTWHFLKVKDVWLQLTHETKSVFLDVKWLIKRRQRINCPVLFSVLLVSRQGAWTIHFTYLCILFSLTQIEMHDSHATIIADHLCPLTESSTSWWMRGGESHRVEHRQALVLLLKQLKEWLKIHLIKGREKHMLALVLMDQVAHCDQPEFEKQIIYLSCFCLFMCHVSFPVLCVVSRCMKNKSRERSL